MTTRTSTNGSTANVEARRAITSQEAAARRMLARHLWQFPEDQQPRIRCLVLAVVAAMLEQAS